MTGPIKNRKMKNLFLSTIFMLSFTFCSVAQTVNTGELVVSPGTIFSTVSNFNNTATGTFINDGDVYAYSNWNNNGMVDFLGESGITRFVGNAPQVIAGTNSSYLFNALFDNASLPTAFQLSGSLSVANESDFNMGVVDVDNYGGEFIFEQFADHKNTSNNSHIDGHAQKIGDNSFVYPIGDAGYYRFAGIDAPNIDSETFEGKYFLEETNNKYPIANMGDHIELVNNAEYWTINRTAGDTDVMVALSWDEATTPAEILKEPYNLIHIARWDETQELWIDEGGIVDVNNNTVTAAVSGYGVFTLARIADTNDFNFANNTFTPNNDGVNDVFEIAELPILYPNFEMKIVNRYGNLVYQYKHNGDKNTIPQWWDGYSGERMTLKGSELLPIGVYYYSIEFNDDKTKPITSWIYLSR